MFGPARTERGATMKPITFESIRNFIKTKKKSKKDGADTSFKRSDSFKRISIRKSYLDRGRNKRTARGSAAAAAAASSSSTSNLLAAIIDDDVKANSHDTHALPQPTYQDASPRHLLQQQHPHKMAAPRRSLSVVAEQHYSSRDDVNDDLLLRNKSLHEINEICGGTEVVQYDVIVPRETLNDAVVASENRVAEDDAATEVQMVQMNFAADHRASNESIYDNLVDEDKGPNAGEVAYGHHDASSTNTSSCSYFLLHDTVYDRADAISATRHPTGRDSPTSTNVSSLYVNHRDDTQDPYDGSTYNDDTRPAAASSSSVTFTTFGEPRVLLETSFDSPEPQSFLLTLTASRDNVSRTSLNNKHDIDSHTYKMPHKSVSDGVVIRIPASTPDPPLQKPCKTTTVHLNSPDSNPSPSPDGLETSLNGKFTFEIYKELQRSQESIRGFARRDNQSPFSMIPVATTPTLQSDDLHEPFSSLQLHQSTISSNCLTNEGPDFYDVMPPADSTIPHSVRLKINPFTRQKELYSVNLGRIWKQLNLGQDDMSLDGSSMQGNFKKKNESFKSMSSQDSGFSLTLTKPKSPYRGRSKKGRRKAASIVGRYPIDNAGHLQRGAFLNQSRRSDMQNNKRRTYPSKQQLAGDNGFSGRYNANEFDQTLRRTLNRQRSLMRSPEHLQDENVFLREFEQFCLRRNQMKLVQKNQFRDYDDAILSGKSESTEDDDDLDYADEVRPYVDSFTQEINDLEAFFEEHLKRLKDYYLQKKQLTERTIDTICNEDYDSHDELQEDDARIDHKREFNSLSRPDSASPTNDFNFPHPDKRTTTKQVPAKHRSKFHAPEVRKQPTLNYADIEFASAATTTSPAIDHIPYADIQFPHPDCLAFPYGKLHSTERGRGWSKRKKLIVSDVAPIEIALSSIFPAARSTPRTSQNDQRCPSCCGIVATRRRRRRTTESAGSSNDEFSEHEFIANSIGGYQVCKNCDRTDCGCDSDPMTLREWCVCDLDRNGREHLLLRSSVSKSRRVKRRKSKRRSGKNHSTLRRCSSYYNSSKCFAIGVRKNENTIQVHTK